MKRTLIALCCVTGGLVIPQGAGAVTVAANQTANCSTGAAPAGFNFISSSSEFEVDSLVVSPGVALNFVSTLADPRPCRLTVKQDATVSGALTYDQSGAMSTGGSLTLTVGGKLTVSGTASVNGAKGADSVALGDGGPGGKAGKLFIRAPQITVSGSVNAIGGDGGAAGLSGNGGAGGDAGDVYLTADQVAAFTGSFTSRPGNGGKNGTLGGANGAPGANVGTIRRNAPTGAGGGTVTAASRPVNQAPGDLRASSPVAGGNVAVSWSDRSDEDSGFAVLKSDQGSAFSVIGTVPAGTHAFADPTPVAGGHTYRYAVQAQFPDTVWSKSVAISNGVDVVVPVSGPTTTTTTPPPVPTNRSDAFSISRTFRSSYALRRGSRTLRLSIRSLGTGRLRASLRVRTAHGAATAGRTVEVHKRVNSFGLTLPRGWRPGTYVLKLITIGSAGTKKTVTKKVRLRYS